ncbi:hypothetical protein ACBJ59_11010 [Nonomuraea sp. MTCD27]|uniref:hypothetical protein n=1 Tax=Nonomuraea sp. MTCD27 TaxID=1676747 RepID=UPI0035C0FE37
MKTAASFEFIGVHRALAVLADQLAIPTAHAIPLLICSGIPTVRINGRVRLARADVTAYAAHLAQQTRRAPVGGGPHIGYEADREFRDGQDDAP